MHFREPWILSSQGFNFGSGREAGANQRTKAMLKAIRNLFGPLGLPGGGEMPIAIFAISVAPLVTATVISLALIMTGMLYDASPFIAVGITFLPFAALFSGRRDQVLATMQNLLGLMWGCWAAIGFVVTFRVLQTGVPLSLEGLLGSAPVWSQAVLFGVFGATLTAQLALFSVCLLRRN